MPKTVRNQFEKALTYENIMLAHIKGQKGKKGRANVIKFNLKKEEYIQWLSEQLKTKEYKHRWLYYILCNRTKVKKNTSFFIQR